jgi:hypothetical protein
MSEIGVSIAVNLEDRDTRRVVLARHRIKDEDARLQPNSSVDLLLDRRLVAVELCRIDLDFSYLNVSLVHFLTSCGRSQHREKQCHADDQYMLYVHLLALRGSIT